MKGDEGVQTVEERADLALLGDIARNTNKLIMHIIPIKCGNATTRAKTFQIH